MSLFSLSILFSLGSAFFGALTSFLARQIMTVVKARDFLTINFLLLFATLLPFAPFGFQISWKSRAIVFITLAAMIDALGNYLFFKSFELNNVVTASTLIGLSPMFTLLLAPILLPHGTKLQFQQILGVVIIVAGITLLSHHSTHANSITTSVKDQLKWKIFPISTALVFGANIYLIKYLFDHQYTNPYSYYLIRVLIIALITHLVLKPNYKWVKPKNLQITWWRAFCVLAQWILLLYAIAIGDPAIVKAIADSSPLFVLLLAVLFKKEMLSRKTILGSLLTTSGILIIGLYPR
ncbi:MAG: DMT family transporter [Anaerolineales bacterium]